MPRRKYEGLSPGEVLKRKLHALISDSPQIERNESCWDDSDSLDARVRQLLGILKTSHRKATNMLFFVMYDIENNKVRTQVAKYLLGKGCFRIQMSIYLADLPPEEMENIRGDLTEVQECYDNHDSILVVPISTDYLQAMKIIGKNIDMDIVLQTQSTLFF